ncbi:hypothetical protein EV182_008456, partial [Spiromyces aspiralis]
RCLTSRSSATYPSWCSATSSMLPGPPLRRNFVPVWAWRPTRLLAKAKHQPRMSAPSRSLCARWSCAKATVLDSAGYL